MTHCVICEFEETIMASSTIDRRVTARDTRGAVMTEEVEVNIREVPDNASSSGGSLVEGLRRLLLASIGAVALSRDETEAFVNKLVERGELAQKDAERLLREVQSRVRQGRPQARRVGE